VEKINIAGREILFINPRSQMAIKMVETPSLYFPINTRFVSGFEKQHFESVK